MKRMPCHPPRTNTCRTVLVSLWFAAIFAVSVPAVADIPPRRPPPMERATSFVEEWDETDSYLLAAIAPVGVGVVLLGGYLVVRRRRAAKSDAEP